MSNLDFIFIDRSHADLTNKDQTLKLFQQVKPDLVVHLAAKVGGLFANMKDKVGFFEQNLLINMNVIYSSYQVSVKRLVCLLSTCIYPDKVEIPIKETDLHRGPPHDSNSGYAFAKRMCEL